MSTSVRKATITTVQTAAISGNGTALLLEGRYQNVTAYVIGSAGVSAGAVQLETADDTAYAGTWAALGSALTVVASAEGIIQATGSFLAVRARISTAVVGGTVTVRIVSA